MRGREDKGGRGGGSGRSNAATGFARQSYAPLAAMCSHHVCPGLQVVNATGGVAVEMAGKHVGGLGLRLNVV